MRIKENRSSVVVSLLTVAMLGIFPILPSVCNGASNDHFDLALRWAPTFYCDIHADNLRAEVPTTIDYDGTTTIIDNWDNLDVVAPSARVYWAAVETESHYFVSYFLYHPRDWESLNKTGDTDLSAEADKDYVTEHEHDLEGVTLVLTNPAEEFVVAYTQAHDDSYYFSLGTPEIPNCLELAEATLTPSTDHRDGGYGNGQSMSEDATMHFDGLRPLVFVEREGHGIGQIHRAMEESGAGPYTISDSTYRFYDDDGIVLVPASDGVSADIPVEANAEYHYGLVSFADEIWSERRNSAWFVEDYPTLSTMRGVTFTGLGKTFAVGSDHLDGAHPSWGWPELAVCNTLACSGACAGDGSLGDWFLDPAHFVWSHIDDLAGISRDYVDNQFLTGLNSIAVETPGTWATGDFVSVTWAVTEAPLGNSGISETCSLELIAENSQRVWMSSGVSTFSGQFTVSVPELPSGQYQLQVCSHSDIPDGAFLPIVGTSGPFEIQGPQGVSSLFEDEFDDGELVPWTIIDGSWSESDGMLRGEGDQDAIILVSEESWDVTFVETRMVGTFGVDRELNLSANEWGGAWSVRFELRADPWNDLQIFDGAQFHSIAFPNVQHQWYTLRVCLSGTSLSASIDGVLVADLPLASHLIGERFWIVRLNALWNSTAFFDYIRIWGRDNSPSSVEIVPNSFLSNSYPNPFNPQTTIAFELPEQEAVTLRVFDVVGRVVKTLVEGEVYSQGRHEAGWGGEDDLGRTVPSGTYFYRLQAGDYVETKRMTLLK